MANTVFTTGEQVTADKINQVLGVNSASITWDSRGRVSTVTDLATSVVYTFAYSTNGNINTITDGDNTWTFSFNNKNQCTGYIKS